ncbi:MAG: hypothetical protein WDW38_006431 [Sanguina aurantia]
MEIAISDLAPEILKRWSAYVTEKNGNIPALEFTCAVISRNTASFSSRQVFDGFLILILASTGIQAADLLGRKILQLQGVGLKHFLYLYYSGYVALAYLLARGVAAAETSTQSAAFKQAKRDTASFYFARLLPRCLMHQAAIESGIETLPEVA